MTVPHVRTIWIAALVAVLAAPLAGQAPDLSGTWKINRESSRIAPGASLAGLGGNTGLPPTLYITQAANGVVTVGSDINESQARLYRPGGVSTVPDVRGGGLDLASKWDGRLLVAEVTRRQPSAASGPIVMEAFSLSVDGQTLTIRISTSATAGDAATTLVYSRAKTEPPCQNWPTPCRR